MYKQFRITVVIPCLNEAEGLRQVLVQMPSFVDEVIVVDNNSTDQTAEVARSFGAKVIEEKVRGYGRAYKTGLLHAQGDIIITLDGDQSYPVDALSYLIEALLHSRVGFVSASRFPISDPETMSRMHRWGNRLLSLATSVLFFRWIRDSQSGMWIFYKDVLSKMNLVSDGMAFSEEIKLEAMLNSEIGFREIPIRFSNRAGEKKLRPWRDGWQNLSFLVKKRFQSLLRMKSGSEI
ncbi:MAG TPA: glycosyltransferase family 2 protein [Acidobacteriota bacterium]|nr:glycosyltransferase family 2 protein [Acidobacteriota bacterium]HRR56903.1 glycosyltransferase family 2 protein [Acidobacteriota bacterium]